MSKGSKLISSAIVGSDFITVLVNNKAYTIQPPTIKRMAGAVSCISDLELKDEPTMREVLFSSKDCKAYARALSWMIKGDESISEELQEGTYEDVINALSSAFELVGIAPFLKAASLTKTASLLTANQSPK